MGAWWSRWASSRRPTVRYSPSSRNAVALQTSRSDSAAWMTRTTASGQPRALSSRPRPSGRRGRAVRRAGSPSGADRSRPPWSGRQSGRVSDRKFVAGLAPVCWPRPTRAVPPTPTSSPRSLRSGVSVAGGSAGGARPGRPAPGGSPRAAQPRAPQPRGLREGGSQPREDRPRGLRERGSQPREDRPRGLRERGSQPRQARPRGPGRGDRSPGRPGRGDFGRGDRSPGRPGLRRPGLGDLSLGRGRGEPRPLRAQASRPPRIGGARVRTALLPFCRHRQPLSLRAGIRGFSV